MGFTCITYFTVVFSVPCLLSERNAWVDLLVLSLRCFNIFFKKSDLTEIETVKNIEGVMPLSFSWLSSQKCARFIFELFFHHQRHDIKGFSKNEWATISFNSLQRRQKEWTWKISWLSKTKHTHYWLLCSKIAIFNRTEQLFPVFHWRKCVFCGNVFWFLFCNLTLATGRDLKT